MAHSEAVRGAERPQLLRARCPSRSVGVQRLCVAAARPQHDPPPARALAAARPAELRAPPSERASALALSVAPVLDAIGPIPGFAVAPAKRLRIAVDVDEVLGRFVHALNAFCAHEYGWRYDVSDYWVYEYAKVWGCDQPRSSRIVHDFFESPFFSAGIPVIPGAAESLARLGEWADLLVVTSRQHVIQDATLEWLDRHFPGTFQEVYFGNHFALEGASRKKSDICVSIGAHALIDDNVGYALDCAAAGIQVLLFDWEGGYPWSKVPEGISHPNIQVVRDWREAEAALAAMAAPAAQVPLGLPMRAPLGPMGRL